MGEGRELLPRLKGTTALTVRVPSWDHYHDCNNCLHIRVGSVEEEWERETTPLFLKALWSTALLIHHWVRESPGILSGHRS